MTLKEFVKAFMEANNDTRDVDEMCKAISKEARKLAKDGCAVLDEEQVEKIILGAKLEMPKKEEPKTEWERTKSGAVKIKKDPPKEEKKSQSEQLSIFEMGVGLFD